MASPLAFNKHLALLAFVAGLLTSIVAFVALGQDDEIPLARVRVAQFAPDVNGVSLLVNGERTSVSKLGFGDVTEWFTLPPDIYQLALTSTTQALTNTDIELEFDESQWTTLAIVGSLGQDTVRLQPLVENYGDVSRGETRLSVLHALEGIRALDVLVNDDLMFQYVNYPGTEKDATGLPNDGYVSVELVASIYDIEFVSNRNVDETIIDVGDVRLTPGRNHFLAAVGTPVNPVYVLTSRDLNSNDLNDLRIFGSTDNNVAWMRVAHFSSGTPPIDIYIDGEMSDFDRVRFTEVTEFIQVEPGTREIVIVPSGLSLRDAITQPETVLLPPGLTRTIAVAGTLSNNSMGISVLEEDFSTIAPDEVRLSVFQGIPGIPPVNVHVDEGEPLIQLLGFPGSQGDNDGFTSVDIRRGVYDLEVISSTNPDNVVVGLSNQRLMSGRNYLLAALRANPPYVIVGVEIESVGN